MLRRGVPSAVTHPHFMVQRLSRGNLLKHGRGSSAPKDTIPTLRRKPPPEPDAHMPSVSEHPIGGDEARHMFRSYAGPFYCPETKSRQSAKTRAGIRGQRMRYPLFGTVPSVCYARTLGRSPATSILRPSRSVARRRPRFERESPGTHSSRLGTGSSGSPDLAGGSGTYRATRDWSQRVVSTRILHRLQRPVAHQSRLQWIYPRTRFKLHSTGPPTDASARRGVPALYDARPEPICVLVTRARAYVAAFRHGF
jgi:hypothetical protein